MAGSKNSDANSKGIVSPTASESEHAAEAALRPRQFGESVDQETVCSQLSLVLEAAVARGKTPDHAPLSDPPELGETTLSMTITTEVNGSPRLTSGSATQNLGNLATTLSSLQENDTLFIDEIHRLTRTAKEMLCLAVGDLRVDVMVGRGPGATPIPLPLPPFTVVGTTAYAGLPPVPLRDRPGLIGHLEYYEEEELILVITCSTVKLQVDLEAGAAHEITPRSCGTLRIANRLLRRVQDWAQVRGNSVLDLAVVHVAPDMFEVDRRGLDRLDRAVPEAICVRFRGGSVGLTALAVSVGKEPETVETVAEPYLVREGFLLRAPRGRAATHLTFDHLSLSDLTPEETLFG